MSDVVQFEFRGAVMNTKKRKYGMPPVMSAVAHEPGDPCATICRVEAFKTKEGDWCAWTGGFIRERQKAAARAFAASLNTRAPA